MDDKPPLDEMDGLGARIRALDPRASSYAQHEYLSARLLLVSLRVRLRLLNGEGDGEGATLDRMIEEEKAAVGSHFSTDTIEAARRALAEARRAQGR